MGCDGCGRREGGERGCVGAGGVESRCVVCGGVCGEVVVRGDVWGESDGRRWGDLAATLRRLGRV